MKKVIRLSDYQLSLPRRRRPTSPAPAGVLAQPWRTGRETARLAWRSGVIGLLVAGFLFLLSACGDSATRSEDYGELSTSPEGITLTEAEHRYGWGKSDCSICHNFNNIHREAENDPDADVLSLARQLVTSQGTSACAACHGANGVQ